MIIGITGGTGSGKSTVCKLLIEQGCVVLDADAIYKELTAPHQPLLAVLEATFGPGVVKDGILDRPMLASIAFKDKASVQKLNDLTHHAVKEELNRRIQANEGRIIILDVPLLFEVGMEKQCDEVWTVTAPLETRIQRVMMRDGIGREQVLDRIRHQASDEERIAKSNAVIENDNLEHLEKQIDDLMGRIK